MRTATLAMILALCLAPVLVLAQSEVDRELTRAALEANRKVLVNTNMELAEQQQEVFWPLYDAYQKELGKINQRTAQVIKDYVAHYYSLTDEKAKQLLAESLDIEEDHVKLKKTYAEKFEKKLPAKTVARYFQLENKFEAIIEIELARQIPLVR